MANRNMRWHFGALRGRGAARRGICGSTLLVLAGVAYSVWGWYLIGTRRGEAVRALRSAGADVVFASEDDWHEWPEGWLTGGSVDKSSLPLPATCEDCAEGQGLLGWVGRKLGLACLRPVGGIYLPTVVEEHAGRWPRDTAVDEGVLENLRYFPEVRRLVLGTEGVTDRYLVYLDRLIWLENLNLSHTDVTDEGLARLSHLTRLRRLDLQSMPLTGEGLGHLRTLKQLEVLRLSLPCEGGDEVAARGLAALGAEVKLRELYLDGCAVGDRVMGALKVMRHLEVLDVYAASASAISDEGLKCFESLPSLKRLDLCADGISDEGLRHVAKARALEVLGLSCGMKGKGLAYLSALPRLRELHAVGNALSAEEISRLPQFPALEVLELRGIPWYEEEREPRRNGAMKWIAKHRGLRELSLPLWGVDDSALSQIALPRLRKLSLGGNPRVTDAGLAQLRDLPELEWIDLSDTGISDAGLKELARFPKLRSVALHDTQVTDAGLEHLKRLKQLRHIWLLDTKVTREGVKALCRALPDTDITADIFIYGGEVREMRSYPEPP